MHADYVAGLDLGQTADYSALAVLERAAGAAGGPGPSCAVRHLQRFPLGTAYTAVVAQVARLFASPPLRGAPLVVDQTGVGRPVLDLLRREKVGARVAAVAVGAGHKAVLDAGWWLVPRKELASTLQVLLQARRLRVAPELPEALVLAEELSGFRVRVTAARADAQDPWREGPHDDLVLAAAFAAWKGERTHALRAFAPRVISARHAWR